MGILLGDRFAYDHILIALGKATWGRSRRPGQADARRPWAVAQYGTTDHPHKERAMAEAAQLRKLVAYNQWANEKILKAIDGLTSEDLARPVDAYFGNLARNLQHILFATRIWLARWKGETPPTPGAPMPASWREAYAATHAEFHAF